ARRADLTGGPCPRATRPDFSSGVPLHRNDPLIDQLYLVRDVTGPAATAGPGIVPGQVLSGLREVRGERLGEVVQRVRLGVIAGEGCVGVVPPGFAVFLNLLILRTVRIGLSPGTEV